MDYRTIKWSDFKNKPQTMFVLDKREFSSSEEAEQFAAANSCHADGGKTVYQMSDIHGTPVEPPRWCIFELVMLLPKPLTEIQLAKIIKRNAAAATVGQPAARLGEIGA